MATSLPIHTTFLPNLPLLKPHHPYPKPLLPFPISSKLSLSELLGGRGLCNGEKGLEKELKNQLNKSFTPTSSSPLPSPTPPPPFADPNAFGKELLGLTGGFPGGEKGLQDFIQQSKKEPVPSENGFAVSLTKPRAPEIPLFMPGMIVIVKNSANPFFMYCGIVQRVTDGKAGVLFEGGNWDRLVTFRLDELERREKGPPMVNPKSAVLESIVLNERSSD